MRCTAVSRIATKVRSTDHASGIAVLDVIAVFNFWEPLHYLWKGYGFQTWETSPEYSIRSWAYILLQYLPVNISATFIGPEKVRERVTMHLGLFTEVPTETCVLRSTDLPSGCLLFVRGYILPCSSRSRQLSCRTLRVLHPTMQLWHVDRLHR